MTPMVLTGIVWKAKCFFLMEKRSVSVRLIFVVAVECGIL
jgi:hypothetical protein